jgi:hypothetical protein
MPKGIPQSVIYGPNAFRIDKTACRAAGFKIFRAHLCCGCCTVDMAFYSRETARIQFHLPLFSDTIRDDQGNIWELVNSFRGFTELKQEDDHKVNVDANLASFGGFSTDMLRVLSSNSITTLSGFADLSTEELLELLNASEMPSYIGKKKAANLIMQARRQVTSKEYASHL